MASPAAGRAHPLLALVGLCNAALPGTRHSVGGALVRHLAHLWGGAPLVLGDSRCARLAWVPLSSVSPAPAPAAATHAAAGFVLLAEPRCAMNDSGRHVRELVVQLRLPLDRLVVVHDGAWGRWAAGGAPNAGARVMMRRCFHRHSLRPPPPLVSSADLDLPLGRWAWKPQGGGAGGHNGVRSVCSALATPHVRRLRVGIGRPARVEGVPAYVLERFGAAEAAALLQHVFPELAAAVAAAAWAAGSVAAGRGGPAAGGGLGR